VSGCQFQNFHRDFLTFDKMIVQLFRNGFESWLRRFRYCHFPGPSRVLTPDPRVFNVLINALKFILQDDRLFISVCFLGSCYA
jgi:hypothetical protein